MFVCVITMFPQCLYWTQDIKYLSALICDSSLYLVLVLVVWVPRVFYCKGFTTIDASILCVLIISKNTFNSIFHRWTRFWEMLWCTTPFVVTTSARLCFFICFATHAIIMRWSTSHGSHNTLCPLSHDLLPFISILTLLF
jgi:hypothetical protein